MPARCSSHSHPKSLAVRFAILSARTGATGIIRTVSMARLGSEMKDDEFPSFFRAADAEAIDAQSKYVRLTQAVLVVGVMAAATAVIAAGTRSSFAWLVVMFVLAIGLLMR